VSQWWVLAVGGPYDPGDFEAREAARVRLRQELLLMAIVPDEYVWVWDEEDRAQLVVRTFGDEGMAEAYAAYLSGRGVSVRVRRAFGEDADG
jgi:hypothetical protein